MIKGGSKTSDHRPAASETTEQAGDVGGVGKIRRAEGARRSIYAALTKTRTRQTRGVVVKSSKIKRRYLFPAGFGFGWGWVTVVARGLGLGLVGLLCFTTET